jgi:hypothetical protein
VILKLDFEKSFDKVEDEVILQVLRHKGFPQRWITWIRDIMAPGTSSVLLNVYLGKLFIAGEVLGKGILYPLCCLC